MPLRVAYIPYHPGDAVAPNWGEGIMIRNLITNSGPRIKITPEYWTLDRALTLLRDYDIICHHNLANTTMYRRRWLRGGARMEKILGRPISALYYTDHDFFYSLKDRPKLMGGIRGYNGLIKGRKILKYFDAIHVNNQDLRTRVLSSGARQAHVLYPGVDLELFRPIPEARGSTPFRVGWAGDVTKPVKNSGIIERLGYPFKMATKENFIPHDEMPLFYNSIDVYLSTSSSEGWGRGIIEAMACGIPVVSSDAGASEMLDPEWVVDGDPRNKLWINRFRNKIEALKHDPGLRREVGLKNLSSVQGLAWPRVALEFERICNYVMEFS